MHQDQRPATKSLPGRFDVVSLGVLTLGCGLKQQRPGLARHGHRPLPVLQLGQSVGKEDVRLPPGFSLSWQRAVGISAAQGRLSRAIGVPLTRSGRASASSGGWSLHGLGVGLVIAILAFLSKL